jgi:hypothetical protein
MNLDCVVTSFWFRLLRRTYPWLPLCIQVGRFVWFCHLPNREQIRFWRLFVRVDFAELLAIVMELAQPEFWV